MSHSLRADVDPEPPDTARQAADLAALRRMLLVSQGTFSLSFAVCDDRTLREAFVQRLCEEYPDIPVVRLPTGFTDTLGCVRSQLPNNIPAAIFVLNLETGVPFEGDSQPILRTLNSSREQWEQLHCPVVFWLAEYAMSRLMRHAPDFWRYRSHQFEFVPEKISLSQAAEEPFTGFDMVDALPFEGKAFRIIELERRIREASPTPSDNLLPHVLRWVYELAWLYRHANRHYEAEQLLRKALNWVEEHYGVDSSECASSLGNLAILLQDMNRIVEAEPMMWRALQIDEASYGAKHPNVAIRLNNLAQLLKATNRLAEAEPLMRRALQIGEAKHGPNHPNVAIRLNNLAQLFKDTNRLSEAEPLMRRALEIDEASYGPQHPKIAIRLNNLARLLKDTNRLSEAEPLMRRALEINEASYGPQHPKIAIRLSNLASLLCATNRLAEAEPLMRRALEIDEASYGPMHPSVALRLWNIATMLHGLGNSTKALPLIQRAVDIFQRSGKEQGYVHPQLKNAQSWLKVIQQAVENGGK